MLINSSRNLSVKRREVIYHSEQSNSVISKLRFFDRWLFNYLDKKVRHIQEEDSLEKDQPVRESEHLQSKKPIHFTIHSATGGRIVEYRQYDPDTDISKLRLYIITNEQDFGKEIDKIIAMELLKN